MLCLDQFVKTVCKKINKKHLNLVNAHEDFLFCLFLECFFAKASFLFIHLVSNNLVILTRNFRSLISPPKEISIAIGIAEIGKTNLPV